MNLKKNKFILFIPLFLLLFILIFSGGYSWWNNANPDKTCASCHEIRPTIAKWQHSAHRDLQCTECHGTALSNGWHSLSEKIGMVVTHVKESPEHENIIMSEKQVLGLAERCAECHQSEHAKWSAGRHATTYADIFLDEAHNKMEPPYWDCFRCHGMHYDGDINDLMKRPETEGGKWEMIHAEQADEKAITCLACHEMHTENETVASVNDQECRKSPNSLYIRTDKRHRNADNLLMVEMVDEHGNLIKVSEDPATKLCVQCHSPNAYHEAGTEDDRTPMGVHEGISCVACHDPHSNSTQNSCNKCHTDESANCKKDVRTMNTSYFNEKSENNIHFISCTSCHAEKL